MPSEFVHLHCHSEFSLLDGLGRIDDLLSAAAEQEMPAIALTDHGTMFGAIDFYGKAKEVGLKPIVGCEVYVADRSLEEKPVSGAQNYHLVLLADSEEGYRNLIKLSTEAHLRGFYRKPRVDHALLEAHSDGLICLSGCANGEVARLIQQGNRDAASGMADWYHQIFGDRYYLELQDHALGFQKEINEGVVDLHRRLGLPLVATNDVHYVRERHATTHEILLCIQTQTTLADPKRMKLETREFYLKSAEQMRNLFGDYPQALSNTLEIAERCNLNLSFGRPHLPRFQTPDGQSSEQYLRTLCGEGLDRRYPEASDAARERLEYELSVISATGFVDYFLLVHDVIAFARRQGIGVGPGRGSAAGSIVAYVLFVTNVDPIAHDLSFERFLNPARVTMPDMDLDFADDRREEVIQYVTQKYGRDRVAQIITFGTMKPRAGVRDVGRCLGLSYADLDRVAKLVPQMCGTVAKAKEDVPELRQLYDSDPAMQRLLDTVQDLEGVARHASTHAAGVVISRDPLDENVPLYKVPKNDQVTTQYPMASIEKIGLLKMDFLGLRTLTILQRAVAFIKENRGMDLELDQIDVQHPSIYELLRSGDTFGVFQVDSEGMRKLLRGLEPSEFAHMVAVGALYRPGPMDGIPRFIERKHGREPVAYVHPALEEVLASTYGIFVYQEQVMKLFNLVAGYSLGEADLVRRAMAKKKASELAKHHSTFLDRAEARGTERGIAQQLWDSVEPFAGYAFPKSHATAYAVITCQTAYLKANYPREYMAAFLSAEKENTDKVAEAMVECRRLGIEIMPPDINHGYLDFTLEDEGIRFALSAVKHVGSGAIESIVATRESGGQFSSLEEFCSRVDWSAVNKRVMESLIRCGALDSLSVERGRMLGSLDRIVNFGAQMHRAASLGQGSLFGESEQPAALLQLAITDPASLEDKLAWELELLGIYVSPHPVGQAEAIFRELGILLPDAVGAEHHGQKVRVGGMIQGVRSFSTKAGKPMGTFELTDSRSKLEVLAFSRNYEQLRSRMVENSLMVVEGKFDAQEGRVRLIAEALLTTEEASENPLRSSPNGQGAIATERHSPSNVGADTPPSGPGWRLTIEIERSLDRKQDVTRIVQLYAALQRYRGHDEVEILVRQGTRTEAVPLPNPKVLMCDQLKTELGTLLAGGTWNARPLRQENP